MSEKQVNLGLVKLLYESLTPEQKEEITGKEGVGLDFQWDNTRLGVKKETEEDYDYQELRHNSVINYLLHDNIRIVDRLPTTDIEEDKIYITPETVELLDYEELPNANININDYYTKAKVNQLLSDYVTLTVLNELLNGKADSSVTYTKSEVNNLLTNLSIYRVVDNLPTNDIEENKLYLTPNNDGGSEDNFDIYLFVDDGWEKLDSVSLDLSDYVTVDVFEDGLNGKVDNGRVYSKSEVDALIGDISTYLDN